MADPTLLEIDVTEETLELTYSRDALSLQGRNIESGTPTDGEVLMYSSSASEWVYLSVDENVDDRVAALIQDSAGGGLTWTYDDAAGTLTPAYVGDSTLVTTGAVNSGSITSGFTSIDVGSGAITTTGTVSGGVLTGTLSTASQTNITGVGTIATGIWNAGAVTSSGALNVAGAVNNFYRAVNSGNPEVHLGASTAEEMYIQTVYDSGAQTLDYVVFVSRAASGTADKGEFRFQPDESLVLTIDDGGLEVTGSVEVSTTLAVTGAISGSESLALATGATVTGIDDGSLGSSATLLATQGAIKTYVDSQVTAQDLDIISDSGNIDIDLDSESLTLAGGTGLASSASSTTVTFAIDSTVATLAGSQTLTNKSISGSTNTLSAIANGSLTNSTVAYGGVSLSLGGADTTPAFNLSDSTAYPGDSALVTVGTIASGTWSATTVAVDKGGTGLSSYAAGDVIYASGATTLAKLAKGSDTQVLTLASGVPSWATPEVGDITSVVAGTGLSGGGTSGAVTLNVEAAQTQITSVGALAAGSIASGFTSISTSYTDAKVTSVVAGTLVDVSGATGDVTVSADLSELSTSTSDGDGDFFAVVDAANAQKKLTKANIDISGFNTAVATSVTGVGTLTAGTWTADVITGAYIDATSSPLANTKIWIGDSSGDAAEFAFSGDATMTAGGVVTVTAPAGTLTGTELKSTVVTSSLTAVSTIVTGVWNGTAIANANLANSTVSYGGISLALGASDATPAFDLADATGYGAGDLAGSTLASGVTASSLTSLGTIDTFSATGALTTIFQATNSGNPEFKFGASAAECLRIQTVYDGSAQTLNYVVFDTAAASGSANKGEIRFQVDGDASGVSTVKFQDAGVDIAGALAVTGTITGNITGNVTGDCSGSALTVTQAAQTAITSVGTLTSLGVGNITSTAALATIFHAANSGNPEFKFGASAAECLRIQPVYDGGAQTLNYVAFDTVAASGSANKGEFRFTVDGDASGTSTVKFQDAGVDIAGALSKGSGSFKIDHPLPAKKDTYHLVHSFIEGPRADLIYRGTADLSSGVAQVDLDEAAGMTEGTWELLCRNPQVWIQNDSGWSGVRGSVEGNTLTIESKDIVSDDTVSWMVVAERCDPHIMETGWTDDEGHPILEPPKPTDDG